MDDSCGSGSWLLIDAAGPSSVIGIVQQGNWLGKQKSDSDFLAMLQPATATILEETQMKLENLSGALYATGPGSTLGLRLAAMFISSLMQMPLLSHWRCLQYQNLELALCESGQSEAVAPWRRDKFHHVQRTASSKSVYKHGQISPAMAEERQLAGFELGRRPPSFTNTINWQPYPVDSLPSLLEKNPHLLKVTEAPLPYVAEEPEFARWTSQRHKKS